MMFGRFSALILIAAGLICLPAFARAISFQQNQSKIAASGSIKPGSWRIDSADAPSRQLCVADVLALVQLAHPGLTCARLVIEDEPKRATLHYSCPGAGWGRTSLLIETPRLVQIDSQGIAANAPFAFKAEARHVGPCNAAAQRKPR